MYGYIAYFNSFAEIALSDGRIVRKIEQPGGGANYAVTKTVASIDDYMNELGEWTEMSDEQLEYVVAQIEE
jgi:hypothetical protein